jgi:hypothetical protein
VVAFLGLVVVVSGGAAASTAALQVPVFALALQVFVVRNPQDSTRTGCCEGSDLAFLLFCWTRKRTCFLEAFAFSYAEIELVAQLQVMRLFCWFAGHAGCRWEWFFWSDFKRTTLL